MEEPEHIVWVPFALQLIQSRHVDAPHLLQGLIAVSVAHVYCKSIITTCFHEEGSQFQGQCIPGILCLGRVPDERNTPARESEDKSLEQMNNQKRRNLRVTFGIAPGIGGGIRSHELNGLGREHFHLETATPSVGILNIKVAQLMENRLVCGGR